MGEEGFALRKATYKDAYAISSLLRDVFSEFEALYTPEAFAATVQSESGVLKRIEQGPIWVAERNEALIGTASAIREHDSIMLRGMAIHTSARGLGMGRMLLKHTEIFAHECSIQSLNLYTTKFLKRAICLYQSSGFAFTGEIVTPHGVELLRMVKYLG